MSVVRRVLVLSVVVGVAVILLGGDESSTESETEVVDQQEEKTQPTESVEETRQPDQQDDEDDELRDIAGRLGSLYAPTAQGGYSPEHHLSAVGWQHVEQVPEVALDTNASLRVIIKDEDDTEVSTEIDEFSQFGQCLDTVRRSTEEPAEDHPCAPFADAWDLVAPPAHTANSPQSCTNNCCEFESSDGQFQTLNLQQICFETGNEEHRVEEVTFRYHPPAHGESSRDLWTRSHEFMDIVNRYPDDDAPDRLRELIGSTDTVGVRIKVDDSRLDEDERPDIYETATEQTSPDDLIDCIIQRPQERIEDEGMADCGVERAELFEHSTWRGANMPIQQCEDYCCWSHHGWMQHNRSGVTGVCFDPEDDYRFETVLMTYAN